MPIVYWPAMLGVRVVPPRVRAESVVGSGKVMPLMTTAVPEETREMVLLLIVMAEPGARVWLSIMY